MTDAIVTLLVVLAVLLFVVITVWVTYRAFQNPAPWWPASGAPS